MEDLENIKKWNELLNEIMLMKRLELKICPPIKPLATESLLEKIFSNEKVAMKFSNVIDDLLKDNKIELKDDETFACMLCVVKKPKYITEVLDPNPEPASEIFDPNPQLSLPANMLNIAQTIMSIGYRKIMEPPIMKKLFKRLEEDKITYKK